MSGEAEMTVEEMVELVHHASTKLVTPKSPVTPTKPQMLPFVAEKSQSPIYRAKTPSLNPVVILEDCLSPAALRRAPPSPDEHSNSPSLDQHSDSSTPPPVKRKLGTPPKPKRVLRSETPTKRRAAVQSPAVKKKPGPPASPAKRKITQPTTPSKQKDRPPPPPPPPPPPAQQKAEPPSAMKRRSDPPAPSRLPPKKRSRSENVPLALSCELTDWCAALTCSNNKTDQPKISYFPFPRDPERCKQWARNAEREDLVHKPSDYLNRNMVLCAKHFEDDQFFNATLRKRLMWDAVPTLFGPLMQPKKPKSASQPKEKNTTGHSKISPFRRSTAILPAVKPTQAASKSASAASTPIVFSNGMPSMLKNTVVVTKTTRGLQGASPSGQQDSSSSSGNDLSHVYVSITPLPTSSKTRGTGNESAAESEPKLVAVATPKVLANASPTRATSTRKQIRRIPYSPPSSPESPRRHSLSEPSNNDSPQSIAVRSPSFGPSNVKVVSVASSSSVAVRSPTAATVPPKPSSALPASRGSVIAYPTARPYPVKPTEIIALMRNHLKEPYLSFLGLHLHRSMDQRVWTQSAHRLLLILYLHSPPQYQVLARMFCLPSRKQLFCWLQKAVLFYPGTQLRHVDLLHQAALNANSTVQLRFQRKSCIVTFRLVAVRPQLRYDAKRDVLEGVEDFGRFGRSRYVATHMLVFIVKGLQTKWTLPIASYPVSSHVPSVIIRDLLLGILNHVEMLGLHTKVIVCSDNPKHVSLFQDLDYTVSKPFVSFRGRRIMVMMDPAYVFRRLRRTFRQYDLQAGKETASYTHIEKFFELDNSRTHRLAPALSHKDVYTEALNFTAARRVFSPAIATGLHTYVSFEQLPPEASGTANVISLVSQLMDCFNGRSSRPPADHPLASVMTDTSGHVEFLSQLLVGIRSWRFVASPDDNSVPPQDPSIVALYKTVSSLLQLWFELKKFTRDHTLHTARFTTREPHLSKLMRAATRGATDATPDKSMPLPTTSILRQTLTEFSTRMVLASPRKLKKLKSHSLFVELLVDRLKNEIQEKVPLTTSTKTTTIATKPSASSLAKLNVAPKKNQDGEGQSAHHSVTFPLVNTVSFIAGHMAQSLFKDHDSCDICDSKWVQQAPARTAAVELFALWLGKASGSMEPATQFLVPSGSFVSFVTRCEELFLECFPCVLHMDRVSKRVACYIRRKIDKEKQYVSCHGIRRSLMRLFVKLRIEHALSTYNGYLAKRKKAPTRVVHIAPL